MAGIRTTGAEFERQLERNIDYNFENNFTDNNTHPKNFVSKSYLITTIETPIVEIFFKKFPLKISH